MFSEQPCEPKSFDVALNIAGVEKYARKTCLRSTLGAIGFKFRIKGPLVTVEIRFLCSVVNDSTCKISLIECWRHLIDAIQFAMRFGDQYFNLLAAVP